MQRGSPPNIWLAFSYWQQFNIHHPNRPIPLVPLKRTRARTHIKTQSLGITYIFLLTVGVAWSIVRAERNGYLVAMSTVGVTFTRCNIQNYKENLICGDSVRGPDNISFKLTQAAWCLWRDLRQKTCYRPHICEPILFMFVSEIQHKLATSRSR